MASARSGQEPRFTELTIGPSGVELPCSQASLGTRQFLPVALHCLARPKRRLIIVEEPEISLHPAAQVQAGEFLAEVARTGKQLVISTHSHYLLQGICMAARRRKLAADRVLILNCTKTQFGTKLAPITMDQSGRIEGWIPSFAEVDDHLFKDWVSSIPRASR